MGHFKSVSRKKQNKRRIIFIIILTVLLFLFVKLCKEKLKISENTLKKLVFNYSLLDIKEKALTSNIEYHQDLQMTDNEITGPLVYIYNTHQTEKYAYQKINEYNLDYDVLFASQILKANLDHNGVYSVVEMASISDLLKKYQYTYSQSYEMSRMLLKQSIIDYPSLKYFIDLHRDSADYEVTTCQINGLNYAKLLFVIGLENPNYQKNQDLAIMLNNKIKEYNDCLTRGLMQKQGPGVNGVYNQDFNENVLLIEVGGQYNSIDEVNNTLTILASLFSQMIKETIS